MKKSRIIGFDAAKMIKDMTAIAVEEQTNRLIEYAKETIVEIGDKINSYNSRNHMDRTGNLLNSLCWGVAYDGELKGSGFYREASSLRTSYLHEFFPDYREAFPVNGHQLAEEYITRYGKASGSNKWKVFFAILAPYWGYWEEGFTMKSGGGRSGIPRSEKFLKFAVMTEFYDKVGKDLSPAEMKIKVHVEHYTYSFNIGKTHIKGSLERAWNNRVNNPYYHKRKRK